MGNSCAAAPDYASLHNVSLHKLKKKKNSITHSHLSNKPGGWNKRGGGTKFAKSLNMEVGINVKGWILWKKLMHNSNIVVGGIFLNQ